MIVLSNPTEGREKEYNDWYSGTHVPDMLSVPGVTSAKRFKLSEHQNPLRGEAKYKYLAIYQVDAEDVDEVIEEIASRVNTPKMEMSDALDKDIYAYYYAEIE